MKSPFLFLVLLTALLASSINLKAQANAGQIKLSLQTGNADGLAQHFASSIDISLLGTDDSYSKEDAMQRIQLFFQQYRPTGFIIKHEGTAPDGAKFLIGTLQTASGSFRTSIVVRQNQIQELSIEK